MATAPIMTDAGAIDAAQTEPVNYEVEARKMGWAPADQFKGKPEEHIDAETFYTRALEYMPIAKATIKTLSRRLDQAEKDAKRAADFFTKSEQRAYERAVEKIRAEQEAAVESGDLEMHRAAAKKLDELEKPPSAPAEHAEGLRPEEAQEALIDWRRENKWFGLNSLMTDYAELEADKMLKAGMMPGPEHLAAIADKVKAKFPEEFEDGGEAPTPRPKPRPTVEGGNTIPPRRQGTGKTFADLPPDAKATCDRWVKNGVIKTREDYVKSYDFGA